MEIPPTPAGRRGAPTVRRGCDRPEAYREGMSLTLGTGPLGTKPAGDFNFSLDGAPAHRIYFEPYPRRVRAMVGDQVVLDSVRGRLLYESNIGPRLYVPLEDIDGSLLEPSETTTHCP